MIASRRGGPARLAILAGLFLLAVGVAAGPPGRGSGAVKAEVGINRPLSAERPPVVLPAQAAPAPEVEEADEAPGPLSLDPRQAARSLQTVALFSAVSLAPAAVLMVTAFVRINVVLVLLRQALGSPQVPGNQVLTALAVLLTALVMRPTGEVVYSRAVAPYAEGSLSWQEAYREASTPIKGWMVAQIERTRHEHYLYELHDLAVPPSPGRPDPVYGEDYPMRVVAPAFLLSELNTALLIGFYLYLPFLVIDLVTAAVLSASGLFMLPPSLVAMPLKLVLFVLADGWLLVATTLLETFGPFPST